MHPTLIRPGESVLETKSVQAWLSQFDAANRDTAAFLVTNLRFVSQSAMERGLRRLIRERARTGSPVALVAVREVGDDESYFPEPADGRQAVAPSRMVPGGEVGSEGAIAHLIRNFARREPTRYLDHPSLPDIRQHRCATFLVVDDKLSTSGRLRRFLGSLQRSKHLRSWISLKWIRVEAVVYSASSLGEGTLRDARGTILGDIHYQIRPRYGVDWWTEDERSRVEMLCKKYGRLAGIDKRYWLGTSEGLGTITFESGCSSICPGILWVETPTWKPLFWNREAPEDVLAALMLPAPRKRRAGYTEPAAAESPAMARGAAHYPVEDHAVLLVLSGASAHIRKLPRLAEYTGLELLECAAAVSRCRAQGLLDGEGFLTSLGKSELRRLRRLGLERKPLPWKDHLFYFPSQLR